MTKTMTAPQGLLERHAAKLAAAEGAEAALYRAGVAWAPAGKAAAEHRQRLTTAEAKAQAAQAVVDNALQAVALVDRELGNELYRLHAAGRLDRAHIGAGGGEHIGRLLTAVKPLGDARDSLKAAQAACSNASGESARLWRGVLAAWDAFREASPEGARTVGRLLGEDGPGSAPPTADAEKVSAACSSRLREMGA